MKASATLHLYQNNLMYTYELETQISLKSGVTVNEEPKQGSLIPIGKYWFSHNLILKMI